MTRVRMPARLQDRPPPQPTEPIRVEQHAEVWVIYPTRSSMTDIHYCYQVADALRALPQSDHPGRNVLLVVHGIEVNPLWAAAFMTIEFWFREKKNKAILTVVDLAEPLVAMLERHGCHCASRRDGHSITLAPIVRKPERVAIPA